MGNILLVFALHFNIYKHLHLKYMLNGLYNMNGRINHIVGDPKLESLS